MSSFNQFQERHQEMQVSLKKVIPQEHNTIVMKG